LDILGWDLSLAVLHVTLLCSVIVNLDFDVWSLLWLNCSTRDSTVLFHCRVVQYADIESIARDTGCLASYIVKGIAYACFYLSRCLYRGHGVAKDVEESKKYFHRVRTFHVSLLRDFAERLRKDVLVISGSFVQSTCEYQSM